MTRRSRALLALGLGLLLALGAARLARRRPAAGPVPLAGQTSRGTVLAPEARRGRRLGGLDLTFLVFSDTHLGFDGEEIDRVNQAAIAQMNEITGQAWPEPLGGSIAEPRGLLLTGDLTEDGEDWQWRAFVRDYGLNGGDGLVRYPVFECYGNHDKHYDWFVLDRVRERHGGKRYAFDWDDLHLLSLGEAPDDEDIAWLSRDLASVGHERPILVYFHFPLRGRFSDDNWFGRGDYREKLARALEGYNLVAIVHGHYHATGRYRWHGFDVYKAGAAKHRQHAFLVVKIDDRRLRVAAWQFSERHWEWWHDKPINGAPGEIRAGGAHPNQGVLVAGE